MNILILSSLLLVINQAKCTDEYDFITREIRLEMNGFKNEAANIEIEIETLDSKFKSAIPAMKPSLISNGDIYKWFSSRSDVQSRRCISKQKNLEMIRNNAVESVQQCHSRVERIMNALKEKSASLKKLIEKQIAACANLTSPCTASEDKSSCLSQAWEQAKQRREQIKAALQRFNIFKKIREKEAEMNCGMCQNVANTYQTAEKEEEASLQSCLNNNENAEIPQPDHKSM